MSPWKTRLPAVDSTLPIGGYLKLMVHFRSPVTGSRASRWPYASPPGGCLATWSPPKKRPAAGSVCGVCFSTVTSSHTSIAGLYQSFVLGLYEPEFQLRPPAIHGHMNVALPTSRGALRPTSSPVFGSMLFTKLYVCVIGHTLWILPLVRSYTNTKPLLFWCTSSFLPSRSRTRLSPSPAS